MKMIFLHQPFVPSPISLALATELPEAARGMLAKSNYPTSPDTYDMRLHIAAMRDAKILELILPRYPVGEF